MASFTRLRRIGLLERWHVTLHSLGMDSSVVASAQYTAQDSATLTEDVLFPALRALIETHAALGLRLEGDESTADVCLVRLSSIDLSRLVEFSGESDLRVVIEDELARGFETQGDLPLWRVKVLPRNVVVFAVHHAIGDGMSVMAFHRNLFRALQKGHHKNATSSVLVPSTPLLPPVEIATNVRPSLGSIWKAVHSLAPVTFTKSRSAWCGNPVPATTNLKAHVRLLTLSAPDVAAFTAACRAHGATLTSTVHSLAICTISRLLADDPAKYTHISTLVALSMHGVCGVGDDVFCDYPSSYTAFYPATTGFSWAGAARLARKLKVQKTKGRERVGMLRLLFGQFVPYMRGHLGKKRETGLTLSNLGRFKIPAVEGKWNIGATFFAQSDVVIGAAFSINIAGDPAGGVNISFVWGEAGIDGAFVEAFVPLFQEVLHDIITE
ncbi:alcohol acetyltransferase-domain-containing protein [Mycena rosella]|uniref:Alcohol acetyltransferase-domain-containing protein n=1 Tax=Mycena rosella TaxID=1033263 RepID=A0AAD7GIH5_MYCRO|nr:alcohol acetyltransferase-domain-containing protein [Mycena rosella]